MTEPARLVPWWEALRVAPPQRLHEAAGATIDADEQNWRPLTGDAARDLSPLDQVRMQRLAAWLWERNPLANRLIELVTAYLLGEGVWLTCRNDDGAAVLRRFWTDPINRLQVDLEAMVREGELYGEQCYPAFVNEMNGAVRLGYLDPSLIETVVMDPDNPKLPIGVVTVRDKKGNPRRYRIVIAGDEQALFSARTRRIRETFADGPCFYKRSNNLLGGKRGRSALLSSMDWLDGYDEFLFGELDRARDLRTFLWDVTLTGATAEDVKKRAAEIAPPEPRSVRVHNDSETWEAKTAELQATDSSEAARLFRTHVLGGQTIPEHWFGAGGDVNRATAGEMGEPTLKVLTLKQRGWKYFLEEMGRWVLQQAADAGQLAGYDPTADDWMPEAQFPELTAKDTTRYAAALQQITASVVVAIEQGLMTEQTALTLIESVAGRLGVEFDPEAELQKARVERAARRALQAAAEADEYGAPELPENEEENEPEDLPAQPSQGADDSAAREQAEAGAQ